MTVSELPQIVAERNQPISSGPRRGTPVEAAPYQINFAMRDPPYHNAVFYLHDKVAAPSAGGGGWEEVALPKRAAVLIWRGRSLMKMAVSVVVDNVESGVPIVPDPSFNTLLHMWRPEKGRAVTEPPVIRLSGQGDAVPYQGLDWVITELEWGEAVGDWQAQRVQQALVVTLSEFREDERLQTIALEEVLKKGYPGGLQIAIVAPGDTLAKIAERYKVKGGWKALGAFQKPPVKDPRAVKVGQPIVIP